MDKVGGIQKKVFGLGRDTNARRVRIAELTNKLGEQMRDLATSS